MNISAAEFRSRARLKLKDNYWNAVLIIVVQGAILSFGSIVGFILAGALSIGLSTFFLHNADRQNTDISDLFTPFKQQFGNSILYFLLQTLFVSLWSLLFIIPGIVASFGYAMTPYILAEHPEISAIDALRMSKDMMKGNKGKYFCLQFSFIGWFILSMFTFGIGILFLSPYIQAANAEFFNEVSGKNVQRGTFDPAPQESYGYQQGFNAPQNPYNQQNVCNNQQNSCSNQNTNCPQDFGRYSNGGYRNGAYTDETAPLNNNDDGHSF